MSTIIGLTALAVIAALSIAIGRARSAAMARAEVEDALRRATIAEAQAKAEAEQHARTQQATEAAAKLTVHAGVTEPVARIGTRWNSIRKLRATDSDKN